MKQKNPESVSEKIKNILEKHQQETGEAISYIFLEWFDVLGKGKFLGKIQVVSNKEF